MQCQKEIQSKNEDPEPSRSNFEGSYSIRERTLYLCTKCALRSYRGPRLHYSPTGLPKPGHIGLEGDPDGSPGVGESGRMDSLRSRVVAW